jgi:hypothetical protein
LVTPTRRNVLPPGRTLRRDTETEISEIREGPEETDAGLPEPALASAAGSPFGRARPAAVASTAAAVARRLHLTRAAKSLSRDLVAKPPGSASFPESA